MALAAVQTAMNIEKKAMHAFFSRPLRNNEPDQEALTIDNPTGDPQAAVDDGQSDTGTQNGRKKRGRKPGTSKEKKSIDQTKSKQVSLEHFARQSTLGSITQHQSLSGQAAVVDSSLEEDPNRTRRKRRKTSSPEPSVNEGPVEVEVTQNQLENPVGAETDPRHASELSSIDYSDVSKQETTLPQSGNELQKQKRPATLLSPSLLNSEPIPIADPSLSASEAIIMSPRKKKKLLKVNKNGKLLSSPLMNIEPAPATPKKRRGRKSANVKPLPTVTKIKYGHDASTRKRIGEKIESILKGIKCSPRPTTPKRAAAKSARPSKAMHPFFLGKKALVDDETTAYEPTASSAALLSPKLHKRSAVTPGKLKAESRSNQRCTPMPTFGLQIENKRTTKHIGLGESPWPSRDTAHVRNLEAEGQADMPSIHSFSFLRARKLKNNVFTISQEEELINRLTVQLRSSIHRADQVSRSEFEPPKDLRLPTRLLTTGDYLQEEVRRRICAQLPFGDGNSRQQNAAHPAIQFLYIDIATTLTAFDRGSCENLSWVQKYAPVCTNHVLQPGKEAFVLEDWLRSLTVMTVGGKAKGAKSTGGSDVNRPPKKKRKKTEDDFIVGSDEEDDDEEMVELPGRAFDVVSEQPAKSFRRAQWTRNKNVVLITGPNGCGKSAMVYAVAKNLGFEVFEINSGSRRSSKDIQDKVGDMTENHLVNHKRSEITQKISPVPADDTDTERHVTALQKDLESGRQGTMMSFFKSSGPSIAKTKIKTKADEPRNTPISTQATLLATRTPNKSQKQSLILFEEVDVLFEEDQQFWIQVTKLSSQSKRPIIITCNNEALVPTNDLPLAAILRLSAPPIDLAADYMLVLAAREGHLLDRDAVCSLYKSKNCDLRSSITELNFWCQMSVGDRKGGLEWMYQRWPPGKDVDEHGRLLRVASKDTYLSGMEVLSHNIFEASNNIGFDKEDELLKEAWVDWGIDPTAWTEPTRINSTSQLSDMTALEQLVRLDAIVDAISAADIYSRIDMPSYESFYQQPIDPSLPPLREKDRLNYTLAAPVIQVEGISDFAKFDTNTLVQTHLLANRTLGDIQTRDIKEKYSVSTTDYGFTQAILRNREHQQQHHVLSRLDFSEAFDLLAYSPDTIPATNSSYNLIASSLDRTFRIVVEDLAPYVRSIVSHELVLETQRIRLGNLLSEGGQMKRPRTTRAARVALEGGERKTKRRERWFSAELNLGLIMDTAGKMWAGMGAGIEETEASEKSGEDDNSFPDMQEE